ncbi:threonylcarbamoyl-AMP synthase [Cohnella pontilimi]|uniref:Threonylcarbamoyl-AMP synthase n=2 Tax=Cohnella pontilimi TaxID=2564100 RepID=A0A4U0FF97_9BACL|nr:L-threonylcarbamoyladenylate synthase [Cohnella pontilimi]TJY42032.1 threonylcarbamoyl-AMP synthase [Cohnella pontilimi]
MEAGLEQAAASLAAGGVVAFPTETVYGLGGDARSTEAVSRIFEAKGRPSDNPLIVHLADPEALDGLAERVNEIERTLIDKFWPGPLTLVLPVRPDAVSPLVTAGLDTVAVRIPAHELARKLIAKSGCPIAAPSANRSGRPSPTLARHVMQDLDGRIDGVLDGGPTGVGLESTVVRVLDGAVHVLRPGGVTVEQLQEALGPEVPIAPANLTRNSGEAEGPRSPGMKYTHYAPRGEMLLITGSDPQHLINTAHRAADEARRAHRRVGVLAPAEHAAAYEDVADAVIVCGSLHDIHSAAQALYAALRECDERGLNFIVAEGFPEDGIGAALMNRLRKAAGGRELQV